MLPSPTVSVLLRRARMAHDVTRWLALDMAEVCSSFSRSTWAVRSRTRKDVSHVRSYALGTSSATFESRVRTQARPPSSREKLSISSCNAFMPGCITTRCFSNSKLTGSARTRWRSGGYGCSAAAHFRLAQSCAGGGAKIRLPLPCRSSSDAPTWSFPLASLSCFVFVPVDRSRLSGPSVAPA